jgi:uncharacterized protein (TIGR03067 family)
MRLTPAMNLRALFFGCSLATISAFAADAPKLDGTWKPVSGELGGKAFPEPALKAISLTISNANYDVVVLEPQGAQHDRGTVKYLNKLTPKGMDVIGTNGPNQGKTLPAIYEIDGDTLRVCYNLNGTNRPTDFKTSAGGQLFSVTYSRKKD